MAVTWCNSIIKILDGEIILDFSIVIPVHNEEANIGLLLEEIHNGLGDTNYEIICVDDHSTDNTPGVLAEKRASITQLHTIRLSQQSGQSCALRRGVEKARSSCIVTLDGDGQNDPADIPSFLDLFKNNSVKYGNCLIIGHRRNRKDTGWRRFSSKVANSARDFALHDNTPDSGCGIKAFKKEFFLDLPAFDHMHRFIPALVRRNGGSVFSHPVSHRPRQGGSSHYGTLDRLAAGIIDVLGVMWLNHRALPNSSQIQDGKNE